MSTSRPVLAILVHGIGPQNAPAQMAFLDRLEQATIKKLVDRGRGELAGRLVMDRADWSHLFPKRGEWLKHLFPDREQWRIRTIRTIAMLSWPLLVIAISAMGTAEGVVHVHPILTGWLVGTIAGLVVAGVAAWWFVLPRFPWGHLLMFGRPFEADTLSDIILYGSDEPRRDIKDLVLRKIQQHLPKKYAAINGAPECLPVVFIGHSLGSVVVYDLLLGIATRMERNAAKRTEVQRELANIKQLAGSRVAPSGVQRASQLVGVSPGEGTGDTLESRREFLERADEIETSVCPVGMITMGSPIALFLFRKPTILGRRDLWKEACPPPFRATGFLGSLQWRWQNFWHPSDLVAHKLGPLFNERYRATIDGSKSVNDSKFVDDVKANAWARDPVSAHSTYWTNPAVLKQASEHLADVLVNL